MSAQTQRRIASAQASIQRQGQLVSYTAVVDAFTPNDPSKPWEIGAYASPIYTGLNNLVNADLGNDPSQQQEVQPDPNVPNAPVQVYAVFLDAKARGSSTQGMVAEMVGRTDIVGGNKECLIAGGQGLDCKIGDLIDRNTGSITGYPIYKVAKLKTVDVDGEVVLWTLELEL